MKNSFSLIKRMFPLYLACINVVTAAINPPHDIVRSEPPVLQSEQNTQPELSEQDMLEAIEQLDNDLIEQLTNEPIVTDEVQAEPNQLIDDFGDVDLSELLPAEPTGAVVNALEDEMSTNDMLNKQISEAKPTIEKSLEQSVDSSLDDEVVSGVGVIGKEEALLNKLDDSNLMDYQTDDELWLQQADSIESIKPPLNFND